MVKSTELFFDVIDETLEVEDLITKEEPCESLEDDDNISKAALISYLLS